MSVIDGILTFPIESLKPLYPLVNTYVTRSFASELEDVIISEWTQFVILFFIVQVSLKNIKWSLHG